MITKEQFLAANKKYKENNFSSKFLNIFYRDYKLNNYKITLITLFFIGNIFAIMFNERNCHEYQNICLLIANIPLVIVVLLSIILISLDNKRGQKIANELNITIDELNNLENKYNN